MTDDNETLKLNTVKQCESDTLCNLQSMEEATHERAMEPELDKDVTNLAKMKVKQGNISKVNPDANSAVQAADVLEKSLLPLTAPLSDPDYGKPKINQLQFQDRAEEAKAKKEWQDEEQYPEETASHKLKEQKYAKDESSATKTALEIVSPMPPPVEDDNKYHPDESKV